MTGSGSPVTASTIARNRRPKGRPNRKRTCVAPTVPSVAVSSFCCALRNTWPAEATTVKTAHNHGIAFAPFVLLAALGASHSRLRAEIAKENERGHVAPDYFVVETKTAKTRSRLAFIS